MDNFEWISQVEKYLSRKEIKAIRVVENMLPFKVNNYVCDELIDCANISNDPIFQLTFPQKKCWAQSTLYKWR